MSACVERKSTARVSREPLPEGSIPALRTPRSRSPSRDRGVNPARRPPTRRSFLGLNLKSAHECSVSREPLLGGRAMGLSIARGLPGYRQAVGREVSLRQSSGGARLRSWGVGFHPAPVGVRWRIPQVTFPPRGLTRRGIKGDVNMWWTVEEQVGRGCPSACETRWNEKGDGPMAEWGWQHHRQVQRGAGHVDRLTRV